MLRKEIKADNTFGGNYPDDIEYLNLPDKLIEITEEQRDYIDANLDKLIYNPKQNGIYDSPKGIIDISQTDYYKTKILAQEKVQKIADLKAQIADLDNKRIRAIAEPEIKDKKSGQTWLEYYNIQIVDLRKQIANL